MATGENPFRIIIVGGGLVGLTTAHILSKTDIDFVILERHENLTPELGSLLSLWPPTFRILDQLDLQDVVKPVLNPIDYAINMSADDESIFLKWNGGELIKQNHGYGIQVTHRPLFIEALYQSLPDSAKARIKVKKHVAKVNVSDDGVVVECADGTVERGSIVMGVDGVHSRVRQCMQAMEEGRAAPSISETPKSPYLATFKMVFGSVPIPPTLPKNTNHECASEGVSVQLLTGNSQAWFGVYEAFDKPTSERIKYTEKDKQQAIQKWGHLYAAPGVTVRDIFSLQNGNFGMINLEEGRVDKWYWNRIVLVSDAIRKLEPHAGLGYNSGVADVVVLVNKLRRLLQTTRSPDTKALEALFADYQEERKKEEPMIQDMSIRRARLCAWLSPMDKIMAKYIIPYTNFAVYSTTHKYGPVVSRAPILDWLEEKSNNPKNVRIPYVHHPIINGEKPKNALSRNHSYYSLSAFVGMITAAALAALGLQYYHRILTMIESMAT
ncbi:putative monooxygenase [Daldinia vernicosa]|uniref:putative monooxygenase n=1 Tax=Daldinia vernicosa TaxID=114800 RepID=UPI0020078FF8|nr:putative monooxygenase [Daldinia vernicosa]KAI0847205.1 putative monooxygenase [Daldinia vernicosa]